MKEVKVMRNGNRWSIYDTITEELIFTENSRVKCFRYAMENRMKVIEYQHGGYTENIYTGYRK